jgi:hypothetical protein
MKIFVVLSIVLLTVTAIDPPTFPLQFTQKFVEEYEYVKFYTVGQMWYDSVNNK